MRVERIVAAHVPPLNEIRPMVTQAWVQREVVRQLEAKGAALLARINKGEPLEAVAASAGAPVEKVPGLSRQSAQTHQELGRDLLGRAFSAKPGEAWSARGPNGIVVGRIDNVVMDSGPTAARMAEAGRGELTQVLFREMAESARTYARTKLKVKVNAEKARAAAGFEPKAKDAPAEKKK